MKKVRSDERVYELRVLVRYAGDLKKPSAGKVQSYLEESLGKSRVSVPSKIKLEKVDGKIVVRGQNDVFVCVERVVQGRKTLSRRS